MNRLDKLFLRKQKILDILQWKDEGALINNISIIVLVDQINAVLL